MNPVILTLFSDNEPVEYALQMRRQYLLALYTGWEKNLRGLDSGEENLPEWGPSEDELADARHIALSACVVEGEIEEVEGNTMDVDDDVDDDLGFEEEEDVGLADALDAVDLADNSRGDNLDNDVFSDLHIE